MACVTSGRATMSNDSNDRMRNEIRGILRTNGRRPQKACSCCSRHELQQGNCRRSFDKAWTNMHNQYLRYVHKQMYRPNHDQVVLDLRGRVSYLMKTKDVRYCLSCAKIDPRAAAKLSPPISYFSSSASAASESAASRLADCSTEVVYLPRHPGTITALCNRSV